MPEVDGAAPAASDEPNPTPDAPAPAGDGLPANDPDGEGATPEEVAAALRGTGMNISDEDAIAANGDDEEGDDPDDPDPAADPDPDPDPAVDPDLDPETDPETDPDVSADADKYTFTVKDANGVTYKIGPDTDIEEVLADFEPTSNGQTIKLLDDLQQARIQKAADDAETAKTTAAAEEAQKVSDLRTGWDNEVKDLTAQKRIPDGDDGKTRINDVYKYMGEENARRSSKQLPMITTFEDALDKLEARESREAKAEAAKAAKDDARKKGGLVGGSSAPATSGAPTYRGGARNATEAARMAGLL